MKQSTKEKLFDYLFYLLATAMIGVGFYCWLIVIEWCIKHYKP